MMVEFPILTAELDALNKDTKNIILTTDEELGKKNRDLKILSSKIDHLSRKHQQALFNSVEKKLADLQHDHTVIMFAEKAEDLANTCSKRSSKEIHNEANQLKKLMQRYLQNNRPSRTNAKFIRFAQACIIKAEKGQPLLSAQKRNKKVESIDDYRPTQAVDVKLAERLYHIATLLHNKEYHKALSSCALFTQEENKELSFHIRKCKGFLLSSENESKKDQTNTIRGILGYAHISADYILDSSPYPDNEEILSIFTDLESFD